MRGKRFRSAVILALLAVALAGCSRDPNVRKQKYFESGQRYFAQEKYREAAIQFLNAVQVDPKFADAHHQLAQCYMRLGVYASAFESLNRAVDSNPDLMKAQIDLGNLLLAGRRFDEAQAKARLVLEREPNNPDAHILMANSLAVLDNVEASITEMQKAIELAPDRPNTYLNLAYLQLSAQQAQAAEQSFRKAVELDPKAIGPRLALGNFYQQQQKWPQAEAEFTAAAQAAPESHLPVAALARLAIFQGDVQKAQQILLQAKSTLSQNPEGYRLLGEFYFSMGDVSRAVAEFASLHQQYPNDLKVKKNYVQLLILQDRLDEASRLNDQILQSSSRDVEGLIHRGQILNRRGEYNESIRVLEAALKTDNDNPVARYHLGVAYDATGNLDRAEREWREAVRLRPAMIAAQQALSAVAMRKGDWELLRQTAEQIITSAPTQPAGYILRGNERLARNDRAGAEAGFRKAIEVAPTHPAGYNAFGFYQLAARNFAQAERLFEQALDRDPASVEAIQGLATTLLEMKQGARAAARVQLQIDRLPDRAGFYRVLGQVLATNQDLEKAEAAFRRATELDSKSLDAFLLLASVQSRRGSLDAAVQTYERNIQTNPRDVRSYILLGALEESRKRVDRARQLYEQALQVSPDNPIAANNLAYILLEHGGNLDVALSLAQVARRGLPKMSNSADTLGWAYYKKGAYSLAIGLLQEALKDSPQNALYHYHLGMAYHKNNEPAKARQHLRRALELQANFENADDARRALAELGG
jgi:tetratricopeptide (TPR) repeat protein